MSRDCFTLTRAGEGRLILSHNGAEHDFVFPNTGNLNDIVLEVLTGKEYPVIQIPGWSPRTIIDIGANVGASAVFFGLVFPEARLLAYEPSPSSAEFLHKNTAWLPQVEVHQVGLFDAPGKQNLYIGTVQCAQASLAQSIETRSDSFEEIYLVRAREALAGELNGPVVIKMDTEGAETNILRDLGDLVDQVDLFYFEYHSERDRREIDRMLAERFKMWRSSADFVHRGTSAYLHNRVLEAVPQLNVLEIPPISL